MNLPSKPKQFRVTLRDIARGDTLQLRQFLRPTADDRCDWVNDLHDDNTPQLLDQIQIPTLPKQNTRHYRACGTYSGDLIYDANVCGYSS